MSTDEQDSRTSGGVPNAFGNALSWRWTRDMSAYLRRSGLPLLLCQLRNLAAASGEIAFASDRKPIRITDIASAACCREKDARRYLEASVRAGVVRVMGERKRGKATRYVLVVSPFPDWQAAEDYLKSTARDNTQRPAKWSEEPETVAESSGHSGPNQYGPLRPELTGGTGEEVRATPARPVRATPARTTQGGTQEVPMTGPRLLINLRWMGPPVSRSITKNTPPNGHPPHQHPPPPQAAAANAGSPSSDPAATSAPDASSTSPPTERGTAHDHARRHRLHRLARRHAH